MYPSHAFFEQVDVWSIRLKQLPINLQSDVHFEGVGTFCLAYNQQSTFSSAICCRSCSLPTIGLLFFLFPGRVPCISFSKQFPAFLITCPEYRNFLLFTSVKECCGDPCFLQYQSFFFAVHDTLIICRSPFITEACMRCSSAFLTQLSHLLLLA